MNYAEEEKTIDLKQMLYYVLKRWKVILIFLLVGVLAGCGFSFLKSEKTLDDLDIDKLNMEKILQYHRVRELYELRVQNEADSIVLQMDPNNVYRTMRSYYVTVPAEDIRFVAEQYNAVLADESVLNELIAASGYDCVPSVIRELVSVWFSEMESPTVWGQYGLKPYYGKLQLRVFATDPEAGEAMLSVLDAHVSELNTTFAEKNEHFSYELLSNSHQTGFENTIYSAQEDSKKVLKSYVDEIVALEKDLSDDDEFYYAQVYEVESTDQQEESSPLVKMIKYAILLGMVFCILGCVYYAVRFILDGHIKTTDEITERGLYTIACLDTGEKKKDLVDRMFVGGTLPANSKEYMLNAVKTLCTGKTLLCGDSQDEQMLEVMKWLASQAEGMSVADRLAKDENGLKLAKEADDTILFVRLWKTTAFDLKRELFALNQVDRAVKGVVVLR